MSNFNLISQPAVIGANTGTGTAMLAPGVARAQVRSYYRKISYNYDNGFNQTEIGIIRSAVNIIAQRMLDPKMFTYTKALYKIWSVASAPGYNLRTTADFERWFNNVQIPALLDRGFPYLKINSKYDSKGQWVGRAPLGRVVTKYLKNRYNQVYASVTGSFEVTLNTSFLGSANYHKGRNADYWAGVIVHEMLHNLGHDHPEGKYDGLFIRCYENAVEYNGDLKKR